MKNEINIFQRITKIKRLAKIVDGLIGIASNKSLSLELNILDLALYIVNINVAIDEPMKNIIGI
jgi:hypothetical protein